MGSTVNNKNLPSVAEFVQQTKEHVLNGWYTKASSVTHLVIGNEAGDADSIISAIGLAYVETLRPVEENNDRDKLIVPIVSIPAKHLESLRPETMYLLSACALCTQAGSKIADQKLASSPQTER